MNCISEANQNTISRIIDRIDAFKDSASLFDDCAEIETFTRRLEPESPSEQFGASEDIAADQDAVALVSDWCANVVHISGSFTQLKAARKTLKKHGLMEHFDRAQFPLDGHWKTEHGLVVVIERKTVRWTTQRASRLRFTGADRCSCSLSMYGEAAQGRLVSELVPGVAKSISWSNGTVWHAVEGNIVGQATLLEQTMTKIVRDCSGDERIRLKADAALKPVSINSLSLPSDCLHEVLQCIGSTTYTMEIRFQSNERPPWTHEEDDFLSRLSQHHPLCQIRHEWSGGSRGLRGQRTFN